jgi:hypothetical protein
MANIEKVANGWIIRGRKGDKPVSFVALTRDQLFNILESLDW